MKKKDMPKGRQENFKEEIVSALRRQGFYCRDCEDVLDCAPFDLDNDNKRIRGVAVVTEQLLVSVRYEAPPALTAKGDGKGGKRGRRGGLRKHRPEHEEGGAFSGGTELAKVYAVPFSEIQSISMRTEFGVSVLEAAAKDGSITVIGRASAGNAKSLVSFFKKAELYITDKTVYSRKKEEPPAVCPKCGKPLRSGATSCDKCVDKFKVFKRMMSMATPHKAAIALVTVIYFAAMAVNLLEPYLNRVLVDKFINNPSAAELVKTDAGKVFWPFLITVLMIFGAFIITLVISMTRNIIMMNMGLKIVVDLRTKLFDKVQQMSLGRVSKRTVGELMNRISRDSTVMQNFLNSWVPNALGQMLLLVAVCVILLGMDPLLLVIFVIPVMITIPAIMFFHKKIHKIYGKQWEASSKSGAVLHDILSGIRVVKAFGTEQRESVRYGEAAGKERDLSIRNEVLFAKLQPFIRFGLLLGNFMLLYYTGDKILGHSLTIGEATMISSYVNLVYGPLNWLANFPTHLNRTLTSANRVFEVLDEEIDVGDKPGAIDRVIEGNVTFENVCFGYDETQQVLKNVSLEIKPGEMVGLVGRSGVGKSTLINLMMRLYDVESGSVKIDGIDIRDYSQECIRSQVGVVLQETILFSGSLYDNVAYAKENATKQEVLAAARASGVHEFAVKLPDGYNTVIGEKGYTLSGGERQRVAIARAILRNPRILILDEATASLDTEIEKQIQEAIEVLIKDRTTVAIAHRLSTLRNAAKIVVLDKGTVAEVGSHEELLRKKGIYYELVMAQRQMAVRQDNR